MAVWVRIHDLPFGLMNDKWGWELAKKVGDVMKIEVDAQGRAWGPYLRAKVQIDLSKPLLRCVTIFSEKRQTFVQFEVRYEKLPSYLYSCGLIGHSSIVCPTPAKRDDKDLLPYKKDLRAIDDHKQRRNSEDRQTNSGSGSFNSGGQKGSCDGKQGTDSRGKPGGSAATRANGEDKGEQETMYPMKKQNMKEKEKIGEIVMVGPERELFPDPPK
ncbi:hypothetical protein QOZ80_8BG0655120 [Eleusine coracana subsp. coracana]|nr:hypothetical protein QOZ80_8BG0655120 [Eleusine coracana subsp. coracana]